MNNIRKHTQDSINNEKGITMVSLLLTIIIMTILIVSVSANLSTTNEVNAYYDVKDDVLVLSEKVQRYYLSNEKAPGTTVYTFNIDSLNAADKNPNDNNVYYKIDMNLIGNPVLNKKNKTYIVNQKSLTVYYPEGVLLNGARHYTMVDDFAGGSFAGEYYSQLTLPIISCVTLESPRTDDAIAYRGDVLTLKILANFPLTRVPQVVRVGNTSLTVTWNANKTIGTAKYTVTGNETLYSIIPINISNYAGDGREGTLISRTSFNEGVKYDGIYVDFPSGSKVIEKNPTKGITMEYNGNQYVWIDVPRNSTVYSTAGVNLTGFSSTEYTKIEIDLKTYSSTYRAGTGYKDIYYSDATTGLTSSQYASLKEKMLKSIYQNEGFWISRYEAGIQIARTSHIAATATPLSKANQYPYTYVSCSEAQKLASKVETVNYTSSLPFGIQWDLVLKFLELNGSSSTEIMTNSTNWGNYNNNLWSITNTSAKSSTNTGGSWKSGSIAKSAAASILLTTGASESFKKMNIYDLAGNIWEWTLEYSADVAKPCAERGGANNSSGASFRAGSRVSNTTTAVDGNGGFRIVLY